MRSLFSIALPLHAAEVVRVKPLPITPAENPPKADEKFGIQVVDEDRWLEDLKNPKVEAWYRSQNDYARQLFDSIPGRKGLIAELRTYSEANHDAVSLAAQAAGKIFMLMLRPGAALPSVYVAEGSDATPTLLIDMTQWKSPAGKPQEITSLNPSPDGKLLAVSAASEGVEVSALHLFDARTGRHLEGPLGRDTGGLAWLPDSRGFVYVRNLPTAEDAQAKALADTQDRPRRLYLHRIGTPMSQVRALPDWQQAAGGQPAKRPHIRLVGEGRWLLASDGPGLSVRTLWATPFKDLVAGRPAWRKVVDANSGLASLHGSGLYRNVVHANHLYVRNTGSGKGDIEAIDMTHPERGARTVVVAGDRPIRDLAATRDGLLMIRGNPDAVTNSAVLMPWSTPSQLTTLVSPGSDTFAVLDAGDANTSALVYASGWTQFVNLLRLNHGQLQPTTLIKSPTGGFDPAELDSKVVEVPSHDGVLVPLSIRMPAGMALAGRHRLCLDGYGAYGTVASEPILWPASFRLPRQGIVTATCHVRGGGERGEAWHRAGQKSNKANTWKDLIACAEWLIANGYTSKELLAISGGSGGGIMIGNAVIERPDLFAAAMSQAGALDMAGFGLRDSNGRANWSEFGDPNTEDGWKSLVGMSSYQRLRPGMKLPHMLLTGGWNDGRVKLWHSGKFAARAQRSTANASPILLDINFDAGHFGGTERETQLQQSADETSFFLWQTGHPDFQPTWTGE